MIIIKNCALVTPQGLRRAALAMEGDKIVRIAAAIEPAEGDTVEDAAGCWVFPGFIDGHTHMQCWTGMDWTADSFATGTRAAGCGASSAAGCSCATRRSCSSSRTTPSNTARTS